ncbi:MAG: lipocalin family protein [Burkholderiaceae bacterium]
MTAALDTLKDDIEAAERAVHAADLQALRSGRALRAHWRAKGPTIMGAAAAALLLRQVLRARRTVPRSEVSGKGFIARMRAYAPYLSAMGPQAVTAASALVAALMAKNAKRALASAAYVDLDRFVGSWFEIAHLPDAEDRGSASDTRSTYARTDYGLRLLTLCRREDGTIKRSTGRAKLADDATQARFKVSYTHPALDVLPFVWSDYTIIDLADDYSSAIVGTADRKHLWLLSRRPIVNDATRQDFLTKARAQGFDTSALTYTRQTAEETAEP